jgi:MFS family permease
LFPFLIEKAPTRSNYKLIYDPTILQVPAGLSITSLSSALTLGVGIGYLINIPLATAIGRRPVVIMSALITAIATLAAGLAGNFLQLLVALAFQGFAVGGTIGMVSKNPFSTFSFLSFLAGSHVLCSVCSVWS